MRCTHPREGVLSTDDATIRIAYRQLVDGVDPALGWLNDGAIDARFAEGQVPEGSIVRGPGDLAELHDIVDDLFGVGCFARPSDMVDEVVRAELSIPRPAVVMPFLETLRPRLERRGPAFWTWKTAREAMAVRLQTLDFVTIEAGRR